MMKEGRSWMGDRARMIYTENQLFGGVGRRWERTVGGTENERECEFGGIVNDTC